jgi:hypothetical protein
MLALSSTSAAPRHLYRRNRAPVRVRANTACMVRLCCEADAFSKESPAFAREMVLRCALTA